MRADDQRLGISLADNPGAVRQVGVHHQQLDVGVRHVNRGDRVALRISERQQLRLILHLHFAVIARRAVAHEIRGVAKFDARQNRRGRVVKNDGTRRLVGILLDDEVRQDRPDFAGSQREGVRRPRESAGRRRV